MLVYQRYDVESVRHYHGLREILPYDVPIRAVHVDAHHAHAVALFLGTKERMKGSHTLTEGDVEDLVLAEVAERGGKARTPREPMLVDTKKRGQSRFWNCASIRII